MDRTRTVAVVSAQSRTRIVKTPILVFRRADPFDRVRISIRRDFEGQTALFSFLQNPVKRDKRNRVVGITATNVAMHAYKPDLNKLLTVDSCGSGGAGGAGEAASPQHT